jgi:CRP-like cAMP-binding protein
VCPRDVALKRFVQPRVALGFARLKLSVCDDCSFGVCDDHLPCKSSGSETSSQTDGASLEQLGGLQLAALQLGGLQLAVRQVRAGTALFLEGTRATHLYVVRVGTFKTIKTAEDGYEQVLAFAGVGEVLGFEALCENRQSVAAVSSEVRLARFIAWWAARMAAH